MPTPQDKLTESLAVLKKTSGQRHYCNSYKEHDTDSPGKYQHNFLCERPKGGTSQNLFFMKHR